jgi:imidazolonepropionase-like amidohydrolase
MSPLQALQSATLVSAQLLGRDKDLGSIAVGKFADLVAVECDPLQDIECLRKVRGVVKEGRLAGRE